MRIIVNYSLLILLLLIKKTIINAYFIFKTKKNTTNKIFGVYL